MVCLKLPKGNKCPWGYTKYIHIFGRNSEVHAKYNYAKFNWTIKFYIESIYSIFMCWYPSHRWHENIQTSLNMCAVSPEPLGNESSVRVVAQAPQKMPYCGRYQWLSHETRHLNKNTYVIIQVHSTDWIWAAAWDFQQFDIWTSVGSDEHLQPPFKLRNSKWCSVSSLTIIDYSSN